MKGREKIFSVVWVLVVGGTLINSAYQFRCSITANRKNAVPVSLKLSSRRDVFLIPKPAGTVPPSSA